MTKKQRIDAFIKLGSYLAEDSTKTIPFFDTIEIKNPWYTRDNVEKQLKAISQLLREEKLQQWTKDSSDHTSAKTVALILAGNIPLVGFHDILTSLIAGFSIQIKPSSDDAGLTNFILNKLIEIEPSFKNKIEFVEKLHNFDLVIATGSNNSARYFEYYFGKKPHIIRKNRNSIGVIKGDETAEELLRLGDDILNFFGLGCRSISKLYLPKDYPIATFFEGIEPWKHVINHYKYSNNYDYNKSIYLINGDKHYDNGFLLLKEDNKLASPLAVVHYTYYDDIKDVEDEINEQKDAIQCVTSKIKLNIEIPQFAFGESQSPALDDYADGINTLAFLNEQKENFHEEL